LKFYVNETYDANTVTIPRLTLESRDGDETETFQCRDRDIGVMVLRWDRDVKKSLETVSKFETETTTLVFSPAVPAHATFFRDLVFALMLQLSVFSSTEVISILVPTWRTS